MGTFVFSFRTNEAGSFLSEFRSFPLYTTYHGVSHHLIPHRNSLSQVYSIILLQQLLCCLVLYL